MMVAFLASCASLVTTSVPLTRIAVERVAALNGDLQPGKWTMDVGVIVPSNFDPEFDLVSPEQLLDGLAAAKEIYAAVDVQINVLWLKTGVLPRESLSIHANRLPDVPAREHLGAYANMWRRGEVLSDEARALFESVIEPHPDNHRTVYLVALQGVFFSYYSKTRTGDYRRLTTPTSGLSFPTYIYGERIPRRLRGVITISNLARGERSFKTIAHEIGHKAINVSHEYRGTPPGFEVVGDGGLMIYGRGVEIPGGEEGRWHRERLLRSPFLYRLGLDGQKDWNPDYAESGHYFDPIYGDFVMGDA